MALERFLWGPSLDLLRDSRNGALWLEHWFVMELRRLFYGHLAIQSQKLPNCEEDSKKA